MLLAYLSLGQQAETKKEIQVDKAKIELEQARFDKQFDEKWAEFEGKKPSKEVKEAQEERIREAGKALAQARGNNGGENVLAFDTTQITSTSNYSHPQPGDPCHPLAAGAHAPAIAQVVGAMSASGSTERKHGFGWGQQDWENGYAQPHGAKVRRLTPRECERLQGFPDDWTLVPWRKKPAGECPDGPRYKALGNSWAVPCVRWIGRRIQRQTGRIHG